MKPKKMIEKAADAFIRMAAERTKPAAYHAVCMIRAAAVSVIAEYVRAGENSRYLDRRIRKASASELNGEQNITISNPFAQYEKYLYKKIVALGEMLFHALDCWQTMGATLEELKVFCNGGGMYWYRVVSDAEKDESFSAIVFACNPDYKNKGDFLETTPDAPLTVCMKEFMLDRLLHTDHGRRAAREAMDKFFPEIMANAIYTVVDDEGVVHYLNKDGVEYEPPKE